jgi:rubrerythrin
VTTPHGHTRASFLLRGALAVGGAYGAAAVEPYVRQAFGQAPEVPTDVTLVDFALQLEYLEADFYATALEQDAVKGEAKTLAEKFALNEQAHVKALTAILEKLGAEQTQTPGFDWGDVFRSQASFLKHAVQFEDIGVSAYNGAAPMIQDKKILAAAGSIVQVEGRHAALVRELHGQPATVAAFDQTLDRAEASDLVAPYIEE